MTRLLISLKHWLHAREQYLINVSTLDYYRATANEKRVRMVLAYKRRTYPYLKLEQFDACSEYETIAIIRVHLGRSESLKMTVFYSYGEDCIIHVETFGDYQWKEKLNIDPTVKRNVVFRMINRDDSFINNYEINQSFFNSLSKLLGIIENNKEFDFFSNLLWSLSEDGDGRDIEGDALLIQDVEYTENRNIEINDERMNPFFKQFEYLSDINEIIVLKMAWKTSCRLFTSIHEKKQVLDSNRDIVVSNVIGDIVSIHLTDRTRHCVQSKFDLNYKGNDYSVSFILDDVSFYGHDICEESEFTCTSKTNPQKIVDFSVSCSHSGMAVWDPCFGELEEPNNQKFPYCYSEMKPKLMSLMSQLLNIIPRYHMFNEGPLFIENDNLMSFLVDHNNGRLGPTPVSGDDIDSQQDEIDGY